MSASEEPETWDGSVFLTRLDRGTCRMLRRNVIESTKRAFTTGKYATPEGKIVTIPEGSRISNRRALHGSVASHAYTRLPDIASLREKGIETIPAAEVRPVRVFGGDCIDAATQLQMELGGDSSSSRIAVLDMASRTHPGGGYMSGAGAQEENLCRRSNLWAFLDTPFLTRNSLYPIPKRGGLYASNVLFIRGNEPDTGYTFLPDPLWFDIVVVAAPVRPDTKKGPDGTLVYAHEQDSAFMLEKIRTILQICAEHGSRDIVLSALGCGAFRNPPVAVARLFKQALREYAGFFRNVVFAIYEDHNSRGEGNFQPFKRELDGFSVGA